MSLLHPTWTQTDTLYSVVSRLQTQYSKALFLISGDFNHVSLDSIVLTFTQYVSCSTRNNRTVDLLYPDTENAYSLTTLPPLGRSDHNLGHLVPV